MSYATAQELVFAFGSRELAQMATPSRFDVVDDEHLELAIEDEDYPTGEPDEAALEACLDAINQALDVADGTINSYLASRYTLPLTVTPAVLKKTALDLARHELHKERATEEITKRRDNAIAWLKDLASGKATLGAPTLDSGVNASGIRIVPSAGRTFSSDSLDAFGAA